MLRYHKYMLFSFYKCENKSKKKKKGTENVYDLPKHVF